MTQMPDLPRIRVNWLWILATAALTVAVVIHLVRDIYPGLPDPMPVHWDAAGVADGFQEKSLSGFLVTVLLGPVIILLSMLTGAGVISSQSASLTQRGGARTPEEAQRTWHTLRASQTHLGWYLFGVNAAVLLLLVRTYTGDGQKADLGLFLVVLAGLTVLLIVLLQRARTVAEGRHPREESEREKWRGLFYRDPDDPRILVPGDGGMNMTFNLGRPAGRLAFGLLVGGPLLLVLVLGLLLFLL